MRIEKINRSKFLTIKDDFLNWMMKLLLEDSECIFHFQCDLKDEDRTFIYSKADNFIIEKNKVCLVEKNEIGFEKNETEFEYEDYPVWEDDSKECTKDDSKECTKDDSKECTKDDSKECTKDDSKECTKDDEKYEIVMRIGRKFRNKLDKYPIGDMGLLYILNERVSYQTKIITILICTNMLIATCFLKTLINH